MTGDCCRDEAIWLCKQKYNWQNHKDLSRSRENLECILFAAHSAHSETVRGRMYIGSLKGCRCHSRDRFIPHCWNWKVRLKLLDCPGSCGGEGFQCSMSNCCFELGVLKDFVKGLQGRRLACWDEWFVRLRAVTRNNMRCINVASFCVW